MIWMYERWDRKLWKFLQNISQIRKIICEGRMKVEVGVWFFDESLASTKVVSIYYIYISKMPNWINLSYYRALLLQI